MPNLGTYEKNGVQKRAYTPADAVQLKFDGWKRIDEPATADETPQVDEAAAETGGDGSSDEAAAQAGGDGSSDEQSQQPADDAKQEAQPTVDTTKPSGSKRR